jgi:hypothetical protein
MKSFPSQKAVILDIPEIVDFRAKFVYNFFTPDEKVSNDALAQKQVKLPAEFVDAKIVDKSVRTIPRFVKLEFTSPMLDEGNLGNDFFQVANMSSDVGVLSISDNITRIQSEETFAGTTFTGFEFQDTNVDAKLFLLVSGSLAKRVSAYNRLIEQQIEQNRNSIIGTLTTEHSLLDAAKALAEDTSDGVSNDVIVKALNQIDKLKLQFIDEQAQQKIIDTTFDNVKNVTLRGQINNKIVGRVLKNIVNDPMNQFSDEFSALSRRGLAVQETAIARSFARQLSQSEFETEFDAVDTRSIDVHDFHSSTRIIGYLIEKQEITANGKLKSHPIIIVENPRATIAIDKNVAYGKTYIYTIRTVAQVSLRAAVENFDDIVMGTGLVKSQRSYRAFVKCIEEVPPPSPADFNVIWDYQKRLPMLIWSMPVNTQRDIKRFQVFKRSNIREPFTLIKQFDFDDSQIKSDFFETADESVIEYASSAVTSYVDNNFKRDEEAIYALCSIDAHGYTSNYSEQFKIKFDRFSNRLKKTLTSSSGAPKSYPNMYLNKDLFVDTIKVSGYTRIKCVFDPEFLTVTNTNGDDVRLLTYANKDGGKYKLQIINTDVQKLSVVDININDVRDKK